MTLQELHDRLLAWATAQERQPELVQARRQYFDQWGEPHEEERTYEARVNGMLDHYLYDYRPGGGHDTTLELFLRAEGAGYPSDDLTQFRALGKTLHGLFEVRAIRHGEQVKLRDLFTRKEHAVTERRQLAGLDKGDLLEARLLPYGRELFFSGAFLFHPREARKAVFAEVKRRKKVDGAAPDVKGFLAQLSRMAQKLERYRNVRVESIYDFSAPAAAPPPKPGS